MSILVVDDDPSICMLLRRVLQRAGYRVQEAHGGQQALEAIAAMRPALVLVDRMMPGMTGDELVSSLRAESSPIPCIMMSALAPDRQVNDLPYLAKPFAMETLLDLVGRTLGWNSDQHQLSATQT